jgi:hypothetical protein
MEKLITTRREFLALPALMMIAGCARTPPGVGGVNATQLAFKFTMNGPVNPSYIYLVAIRVLTPPFGSASQLSDPTQVPVPVYLTGSKNGIVEGQPTHYVLYTAIEPNLYEVYRFLTQVEAPDPSQSAGMNLTWPGVDLGPVIVGSGLDPTTGDPNSLGFTIDTSYLDQFSPNTTSTGNGIQTIQFNIITTNEAALNTSTVSQKVTDSCGNLTTPTTVLATQLTINLATNGTYTDQTQQLPETANDTYPGGSNLPPVDMTSWSLTVTPP